MNDGTRLRYAKGLTNVEIGGRHQIAHGGGIFGFLSESRYYPEEDLIIVVLINTGGAVSPSGIADTIEELVLGERESAPERAYAGNLETFVGTYKGRGRGNDLIVVVAVKSGGLTLKIGDGEMRPLAYRDATTFALGTDRYSLYNRYSLYKWIAVASASFEWTRSAATTS